MKKNGFILYAQQYESVKHLSLEDKGRLFDAIFQYHIEDTTPDDLPPVIAMALSFIKTAMDIDSEKYSRRIEANRENGKQGGRPPKNPIEPKKPNGLNGNQKNPIEPKKGDTVTDTVTDTDLLSDSAESTIYPFSKFWDDYDKKVGKVKTQKKWDKISNGDKLKIRDHIPKYKASQPDKQFRKNPEVYLNNESWNDEIINAKTKNNEPEPKQYKQY